MAKGKCKCDWCKVSKRLRKIQSKMTKRDANYLEGFVCFHLDVATENDWRKAILNGTWPESGGVHKAYLKWKNDRVKDLT